MIIFSEQFDKNLEEIKSYICLKDSEARFQSFATELFKNIENVEFMPLKHRKNSQLNQENIRDLIYKGYTIPFLILENSDIFIITIYKYKQWDGKVE